MQPLKNKAEEIFSERIVFESEFLKDDLCKGKKPVQVKQCSVQIHELIYKCLPFVPQQKFQGIVEEKVFENILPREKVSKTLNFPYSSIGLVKGEMKGNSFFGSGCLIGPNIVLTCAHNCYSQTSQVYAEKMEFVPSLNGTIGESFVVEKFYFPDEYKQNSKEYSCNADYAILILKDDLSKDYGYLGIDTRKENVNQKQEYEVCGYPSDTSEKDKKTQWKSNGPICEAFENQLQYNLYTYLGQSGSPLFYKKDDDFYIVGVHTGARPKKKVNAGIRLTRQVRKRINQWVGYSTGNLDLSLLGLEDEEIKYLAEEKWSKKLVSLNLITNPITSEGIRKLAEGKWDKLRVLDLSFNQFDEKALRYLKGFENLRELSLEQCKLTGLGVKILSECEFPFLNKLNLSDNKLEDDDILYLAGLKSLKSLNLNKNKVSAEGVNKLRKKFKEPIQIKFN